MKRLDKSRRSHKSYKTYVTYKTHATHAIPIEGRGVGQNASIKIS